MSEDGSSLVQHQEVGAEYLQRRELRQSAGWVLLWALGVACFVAAALIYFFIHSRHHLVAQAPEEEAALIAEAEEELT